ncbi:hypothetical protein PCE1_002933 [Barthelona sp. PCE]
MTIVEMTAEDFITAIESEQFQKFKVTNEMTRHDAAIIDAGDKHTIQSLVTEEVRNVYFSACIRAMFSSVFDGEVMTRIVESQGIAKVFQYYKNKCAFVDEEGEKLRSGELYDAHMMVIRVGALLNTQPGQTMKYREPSEQDQVTMMTIQISKTPRNSLNLLVLRLESNNFADKVDFLCSLASGGGNDRQRRRFNGNNSVKNKQRGSYRKKRHRK